jgi:hypothetical protein
MIKMIIDAHVHIRRDKPDSEWIHKDWPGQAARAHALEVLSILSGDFMSEPGQRNDYIKELEDLIQAQRQPTK